MSTVQPAMRVCSLMRRCVCLCGRERVRARCMHRAWRAAVRARVLCRRGIRECRAYGRAATDKGEPFGRRTRKSFLDETRKYREEFFNRS